MKLVIGGLPILIVLLVSALLPGSAQGTASQAQTPPDMSVTYGINPAHDGYIADSALAPPLKRLWAIDLKGGVSYPLVVGNLVYVVVAHTDSQGGYGGGLVALDIRTGATTWGPVEQGGVYWPSSLAYADGKVFSLNKDGILRAYNAQTGTPAWGTQLDQAVFNDAPLVARDGLVYAPVDHGFEVVDATNGALLWRGTNEGSPALGPNAVYAGGCGSLAAYVPRTGAILWQQTVDACHSFGDIALVFHQDRLYATDNQGALYVFDATSGQQLQIYTSSTIPAFVGGQGFTLTAGTLQSFDVSTGAIRWSYVGDGHLSGPPIVVGNHVYIQSEDAVYVVDPVNGHEVFSTPILPDGLDAFGVQHVRTALGAGSGELIVPYHQWLVAFGPAAGNLPPLAPLPSPTPRAPEPPAPATGPDESVAFQVNPAHTGSLPNDPLTPPLKQLWSVNLTDTVSNPLIVGHLAYVLAGQQLLALDTETGARVWGPILQGGTYQASNFTYDNGRVFVINFDGIVRAYEAQTGTPVWSTKLPDQWVFDKIPVAYKGTLYVGGAGSGSTLYAIDETNGALLWTAHPSGGSAAITDDAVYSNGECGAAALDPRTGTALWQQPTINCSGLGGVPPVVYKNRVYMSDGMSALYVYDAASGQPIQIYSGIMPAFAGNRGFVVAGRTLQAFDVTDGTILWSFAGDGNLSSLPLVVHNTVYIDSQEGTLYGVDAATGRLDVTVTDLGSEIYQGLGAGNGKLLVPAGSHLVAFTSASGGSPAPTPTVGGSPVPAPTSPTSPQTPAWAQPRFFAETGHTIQGRFRQYWEEHGGLAQQGYPLTEELAEVSALDGKSYTTQYFERAVFEMHPENSPPYDVLLSQLGTLRYQQKYPQGAPNQQRNPNDAIYFPETSHAVGGSFRPYWETHGGLAQLGYPLSEEFPEKNDLDGRTYTVQYFERMVLEWHPDNQPPYTVLGSQLGRFAHDARYPAPPSPR